MLSASGLNLPSQSGAVLFGGADVIVMVFYVVLPAVLPIFGTAASAADSCIYFFTHGKVSIKTLTLKIMFIRTSATLLHMQP